MKKTIEPPRWSRATAWFKKHSDKMPALLVALGAPAALISCATLQHAIVAPPNQIPGAEFVGSAACEDCHADVSAKFKNATHSRLKAQGDKAKNIGCESCHGPGSKHVEAGGGRGSIVNPRRSPDVCFQCHLDKRGEFSLPYTHPVLSGKVSCTDCHDPHKGNAIPAGGTELATEFDTCGKCHTAQRGPFVFEHEAVREGCGTCHKVHGSVNPKMLKARNANLCLQCHFQQQTVPGQIWIGGRDHSSFLSRGTCWSAGCHEAIHGSQIGSSLRF
ncbi:MAG TPA: cytochrome c3 family protein [Verrucomicrobiae bacterium]|nr:cytochrome c3 family protein [Verrucomicrobiae bacterium]